ncbi:MAG TPA: 2-dehydro-3-deoxygalactonokinase [Rhodanobacteraceae bacterium]
MHGAIGIDWGTSRLRAMLFDADGKVREERRRPWGIRHLPEGGFARAFAEICDGWPPWPAIASGMVGSRQGWHEVGYVDAPAGVAALAAQVARIEVQPGRWLSIVPGVRDTSGPDVMRGEETEVAGALALNPDLAATAQLVLPGTHSKWVDVRDGKITRFRTLMTGELYGLLTQHSILGAMLPAGAPAEPNDAAFDAGVQAARDSANAGVLTRIFSARTRVLGGLLAVTAVPDYISGLLIGDEWRAMLASGWSRADTPPVLVGDARQCARYQRAARGFELPPPRTVSSAAAPGLWQIHKAIARSGARSASAASQGHH